MLEGTYTYRALETYRKTGKRKKKKEIGVTLEGPTERLINP